LPAAFPVDSAGKARGDGDKGSAVADMNWQFRHWPHRCVFLGDGIQAWLIGLKAGALPLPLALDESLTLIVTFGEATVIAGGDPSHLVQGQFLATPAGTVTQIDTDRGADVLLLMTEA
jgi:hypothetical protein